MPTGRRRRARRPVVAPSAGAARGPVAARRPRPSAATRRPRRRRPTISRPRGHDAARAEEVGLGRAVVGGPDGGETGRVAPVVNGGRRARARRACLRAGLEFEDRPPRPRRSRPGPATATRPAGIIGSDVAGAGLGEQHGGGTGAGRRGDCARPGWPRPRRSRACRCRSSSATSSAAVVLAAGGRAVVSFPVGGVPASTAAPVTLMSPTAQRRAGDGRGVPSAPTAIAPARRRRASRSSRTRRRPAPSRPPGATTSRAEAPGAPAPRRLRRVGEPGVRRADADQRDRVVVGACRRRGRVDRALEAGEQRVGAGELLAVLRGRRRARRGPWRRARAGRRRAPRRRPRGAAGRAGRCRAAGGCRGRWRRSPSRRRRRRPGASTCGPLRRRRRRGARAAGHGLGEGREEAPVGAHAGAEALQRGQVLGVDRRREAVPAALEGDDVAQLDAAGAEGADQRPRLLLERADVEALLAVAVAARRARRARGAGARRAPARSRRRQRAGERPS